MTGTNGKISDLQSDTLVARSLPRGPAAWSLGRMVVVVFAVCMAAWLAIIGYLLSF
jgi:hypothetical protein